MTASPAPITHVDADHRRQDGAERDRAGEREAGRRRGRAGDDARATRRRRRRRAARRAGAAARAARRASAPPVTSAPATPMFITFAPSALTPPSANTKLCVASTTASTRQASHGPSSTVASAAPRKCPLVPPATGKLSICAAKTNAPVTPSSGTTRSSSRRARAAQADRRRRRSRRARCRPRPRGRGTRQGCACCSFTGSGIRGGAGSAAQSGQSPTIGKWREVAGEAGRGLHRVADRRERRVAERRVAAAGLARGVAAVAPRRRARSRPGPCPTWTWRMSPTASSASRLR